MPDGNEDKLNKQEQTTPSPETTTPTSGEVNDFPKIAEILSDEKFKNRNEIKEVLDGDEKLKKLFEEFLNSSDNDAAIHLCKRNLKKCSSKHEIKSIIIENIPGGYKIGEPEKDIHKEEEIMNKKEGQAQEKQEQAQEKQEQAQIKEEQAQEIEKKVNEEKSNKSFLEKVKQFGKSKLDGIKSRYKEISEELKKTRSKLSERHADLEENTKEGSEKFNKVKNELENKGILNQIRQKTKDEEFVNSYILSQTTLLEAKSNPEYSKDEIGLVEKIIKQMNNACNIPDTSLDSFSSDNIGQTRKELFNEDIGNDSIISAKKSNMESRDYSKVFPEMGDDELISKYGNQLEGELKDFWNQYQSNPEIKNKINEIKNNPNPTEEEKKLLKNYEDMIAELRKIKEGTEIQAKDLIEEMCLISQIKGLSMCIGKENKNDFNFNKANEIQNNNGVLTLQGHIDGVDFSVRQDTNNPEARLQTYSKMATTGEDKNTFAIGGENNYVDSPFILPSQQEIFAKITEVVQSDSESLKNAENQETYLENLQKEILSKMDDLYKDTELAHHYITNKVKGEKIVDSSLGLIQYIKPGFDFSKSINQASNAKLYSFLKIINFNIENSTTEEKDKLNRCISKIGEIVDKYRSNQGKQNFDDVKYPPIIENYLKNEDWMKDGNEDTKFGLISDLFDYYRKNSRDMRANSEGSDGAVSKMIISDLYRDLFENTTTGESEIASKRWNENKEKQDKKEADQILDLENESIWS